MSTIKFTVEIDEQYIRDHADAKKVLGKQEENGKVDTNSAIRTFVESVGFGIVTKQIDEGTTEFIISRDGLGENSKDIFDRVIGSLAVLAAALSKEDAPKEG